MKSWQMVIISWSRVMSTAGLIAKTPRNMQGRLPIHTYDIPNYHTRVPVCSNHFLKQSFLVRWAFNEETALRWDRVGCIWRQFSPFPVFKLAGYDFVALSTARRAIKMLLLARRDAHVHAKALMRCTTEIHFWRQSALLSALNFYCCCCHTGFERSR